jgi:hypothetical protein
MDALDRGVTIEVEDRGTLKRFESYDNILVESRRVCEERVTTERPCNENERFSENCIKHGAAEPKKRTTCRTPKASFDKPFIWSSEKGDLSLMRRREQTFFKADDLAQITLREDTSRRALTVAGTALLVASAVATGTYFALDAGRPESERGEPDVAILAVGVGVGLGAASLTFTLPLTSPDRVSDEETDADEPL